jgi:UDP-N-acetylmuramoyl-tripeptide--D-alanyl-D-alanine ligase
VGDVEGVARAKGELIDGLEPGAVLVYNADDGRLASRAASFLGRKVSFGFGPEAAVRATGRQVQGNVKQTAQLSWRGQSWPLSLPVPGQHQVYNALAATAVGLALGLQPAECAAALAGFTAIPRRSQVMQLPSGVHLLNDCYNANPGSMGTALRTLVELKEAGRAAAALGDMLELGDCTAAEHRELGRLTAGLGLDLLVVYGKMREEVAAGAREGGLAAHRIYPVVRHVEGAMILKEFLQPGDWLLVKGSRSTHMENLVENLVRQE